MTNSEILKQFSDATGITDPKVESIVRHQESWVHENYDKNVTTTMGVDEGEPMTLGDVEYWGSFLRDDNPANLRAWPYRNVNRDYKQYVEGDWKPHKKQEEFHKSKKLHKTTDDRISDMLDILLHGRGAAFGDDKEYIDAEWREVEKPLMLPPHIEKEKDV